MGAFADAPTQSGHPTPNIARCGMGAKTPFSFKKGVEILTCKLVAQQFQFPKGPINSAAELAVLQAYLQA